MLPFHLKELKSSSTGMGCFLLSLVEIGPVVLKNMFLCPLFRNYLRMEKEGALHLNNIESPSQKDNLAKLVYIAQWFWRRRFLKMCHWFFPKSLFSPVKGTAPFIWTNLNPLHPMIFWAKFGWNCPLVLEKLIFRQWIFTIFFIISTWKQTGSFI